MICPSTCPLLHGSVTRGAHGVTVAHKLLGEAAQHRRGAVLSPAEPGIELVGAAVPDEAGERLGEVDQLGQYWRVRSQPFDRGCIQLVPLAKRTQHGPGDCLWGERARPHNRGCWFYPGPWPCWSAGGLSQPPEIACKRGVAAAPTFCLKVGMKPAAVAMASVPAREDPVRPFVSHALAGIDAPGRVGKDLAAKVTVAGY